MAFIEDLGDRQRNPCIRCPHQSGFARGVAPPILPQPRETVGFMVQDAGNQRAGHRLLFPGISLCSGEGQGNRLILSDHLGYLSFPDYVVMRKRYETSGKTPISLPCSCVSFNVLSATMPFVTLVLFGLHPLGGCQGDLSLA
jgi:hypothetical protein